jgi:LMBR1 domain-containing protein 1
MAYFVKFIMGVISLVVSFVIVLQVLLFQILKVNGKAWHPFINNILEAFELSDYSVFSTLIISFIGAYILACCIKGNSKFGLRFFFFTFYPMCPNETFVNSFLFNALLLNLEAFAFTQFMTNAFRSYTRFTDISIIFEVHVRHMWLFSWFWTGYIFSYIFIVWFFISLTYFTLKPLEMIRLGDETKLKDMSQKH